MSSHQALVGRHPSYVTSRKTTNVSQHHAGQATAVASAPRCVTRETPAWITSALIPPDVFPAQKQTTTLAPSTHARPPVCNTLSSATTCRTSALRGVVTRTETVSAAPSSVPTLTAKSTESATPIPEVAFIAIANALTSALASPALDVMPTSDAPQKKCSALPPRSATPPFVMPPENAARGSHRATPARVAPLIVPLTPATPAYVITAPARAS